MQDKNLVNVNLTKEMKTSFIDYAMSVIVSRALPDVRTLPREVYLHPA